MAASGASNQDLALGYSPGLDISLDSSDKQVIHVTLLLITLMSASLSLSLAHDASLSLSLPPPHTVPIHCKVTAIWYLFPGKLLVDTELDYCPLMGPGLKTNNSNS